MLGGLSFSESGVCGFVHYKLIVLGLRDLLGGCRQRCIDLVRTVQGDRLDDMRGNRRPVTDVYSHIFDADRKRIAALMETSLFSDQSSGTKDVKPEDILNRLQNATPEMQKALFTILGL